MRAWNRIPPALAAALLLGSPAKLATALEKCSTKLADALGRAVTKYGAGDCTAEGRRPSTPT